MISVEFIIAEQIERNAPAKVTAKACCPKCGRFDTDAIPKGSRLAEWVECSECKQWWHAPCAGIEHETWKKINDGDDEFVCDHCMTTRAHSSFAAASSCSDFPSSDPDTMSVEAVAESSCVQARRKHKYIICQEDDE